MPFCFHMWLHGRQSTYCIAWALLSVPALFLSTPVLLSLDVVWFTCRDRLGCPGHWFRLLTGNLWFWNIGNIGGAFNVSFRLAIAGNPSPSENGLFENLVSGLRYTFCCPYCG